MCGFLFYFSKRNTSKKITRSDIESSLSKMIWRGPDSQKTICYNNDSVILGHNRLTIIDNSSRSNQPMISQCGSFAIVCNGEIYNHQAIRLELNLNCQTSSDIETIIEGYAAVGNKIFEMLDGMFSLVIYNIHNNTWVAARDAFGIKPLFIAECEDKVILGSEPAIIADLINSKPCPTSIEEWKIIRRPMPGFSFFKNVNEFQPGTIFESTGDITKLWHWKPSQENFSQIKFEKLLKESVISHELSDVENVSLLSGGLDSAIITALSKVKNCYSVGLEENNEFEGAQETADFLERKLHKISTTPKELTKIWRQLVKLRGEPLSLPNEGLIFKVCSSMNPNEKVVLTGEGADELFFGYDGIFRWALEQSEINSTTFLLKYGYSDQVNSNRLLRYVDTLKEGKSPIEFVEDFFYQVHLPGLLRRMDFASMAASKEARVPFVTKSLIGYVYRQPAFLKINSLESKIPIRKYAEELGLTGALNRKKIGFSAQTNKTTNRVKSYQEFQNIILEELEW